MFASNAVIHVFCDKQIINNYVKPVHHSSPISTQYRWGCIYIHLYGSMACKAETSASKLLVMTLTRSRRALPITSQSSKTFANNITSELCYIKEGIWNKNTTISKYTTTSTPTHQKNAWHLLFLGRLGQVNSPSRPPPLEGLRAALARPTPEGW